MLDNGIWIVEKAPIEPRISSVSLIASLLAAIKLAMFVKYARRSLMACAIALLS